MTTHIDAATVSALTSGTTAATVATTSALGIINEYAVIAGLLISVISLIAAVYFKVSAMRKEDLRYQEELKHRQLESLRAQQQMDTLVAMLENIKDDGA